MSLHFVGMGRSPKLGRSLTSPSPSYIGRVSSPEPDLPLTSKNILARRLADLSTQVASGHNLTDDTVSILHKYIDQLDQSLKEDADGEIESDEDAHSRDVTVNSRLGQDKILRLPSTPPTRPLFAENLPEHVDIVLTTENSNPSVEAAKLANETADLVDRLKIAMKEFQSRKEETDVS
jgi:hypothetical protein